MPAGDELAGDELAGEDVLPAGSPARSVTPPDALLFDGRTRDFPLLSSGLYQASHPVDQAVAEALLITLGKVSCAPTTGNRLRQIKRIVPSTENAVRDAITNALQKLTQNGDVSAVRIDYEARKPSGAVLVAVTYRNLRTGEVGKVVSHGA
jgi:hypothetical protein